MKRFLLQISALWVLKAKITFTLQANNNANRKSYLGFIEVTHRIFNNSYLFPFYWYANGGNTELSKRFLGSYELTDLYSIAFLEAKKMALQDKRQSKESNKLLFDFNPNSSAQL